MAFSGSAEVPRRLPSYTELARARKEAEELEEVRLAYGGTLPDEKGDWQPHWVFVGEVIETVEKT